MVDNLPIQLRLTSGGIGCFPRNNHWIRPSGNTTFLGFTPVVGKIYFYPIIVPIDVYVNTMGVEFRTGSGVGNVVVALYQYDYINLGKINLIKSVAVAFNSSFNSAIVDFHLAPGIYLFAYYVQATGMPIRRIDSFYVQSWPCIIPPSTNIHVGHMIANHVYSSEAPIEFDLIGAQLVANSPSLCTFLKVKI